MSHGAPEFGQGERSLSRAATLVAEAKHDLDGHAHDLEDRIAALRGRWVGQGGASFFALHQAWTEKQAHLVRALDEFEASLVASEHDNLATDEAQSASYARTAGRLDGV